MVDPKTVKESITNIFVFMLENHSFDQCTCLLFFYRGYQLECFDTPVSISLRLRNNSFETDQLIPGRKYTFTLRGYTYVGGFPKVGPETEIVFHALAGEIIP